METPSNPSFNSSLDDFFCTHSEPSRFMYIALLVLYVLLVPLFVFVFYVVCAKWKNQRSENIVHSDVFLLNMAAAESMNIMGLFLMYCSLYKLVFFVRFVGGSMYYIGSFVQVSSHSLTCLERYLAVVHPVTYLRLKNQAGVTIRNTSIVLMWVFGIGSAYSMTGIVSILLQLVGGLLLNTVTLFITSLCSVAVLRVLIRPGPGDGGGNRKRADQLKRAAFDTIMAILGVLMLRFTVTLIYYIDSFLKSKPIEICLMTVLTFWFKLPSSLVLPLLFLHREGKLPACTQKQ